MRHWGFLICGEIIPDQILRQLTVDFPERIIFFYSDPDNARVCRTRKSADIRKSQLFRYAGCTQSVEYLLQHRDPFFLDITEELQCQMEILYRSPADRHLFH